MSSHHSPQQLRAELAEAPQALVTARETPEGPDIDGLAAAFYDQQTGQVVQATPVTADNAAGYRTLQTRRAGAFRLAGATPTAGDWVITQGNGATALQADVVVGADFLRRYAPADDRAVRLLAWLNQTTGGTGAGRSTAAARLAVYDVITA